MNINQLVLNGLETITNAEKFSERRTEVIDAAFDTIFRAGEEDKLVWTRDLTEPYGNKFTATARVSDARGEEISVPIILYKTCDSDGFPSAYLHLGAIADSVCMNNADERVGTLFNKVAGKSYKE